ncbi:MAG: DUF1552 domain-containing protein, partial [Bryobacterales bacterium]|nr:DUF1552 domain-containing protein [Bryobacterales bacterium]
MLNRTDRRNFLRGVGASLALPMLESFAPRSARGAQATRTDRLVCIGTYLGFYQSAFYPQQTGPDYEISPVLKPIERFRDQATIFSGLDHRGRNGHAGWRAWMSGSAAGSVSLDQVVAAQIGDRTRFDSLQISCGNSPGSAQMSFTPEGVALPMIGRPSVLYSTLFSSGDDAARTEYLLASNGSVLDGVTAEARSLERTVTASDRHKLGEYFASLRAVEKRLQKQRLWLDRPIPQVDYPLPEFDPIARDLSLECESIMYDLMALALTTDSTRVATFMIPGGSQIFTIGGRKLSAGYHGLSHHGNDPGRIAEYNQVGIEHVKRLGAFLDKLATARDAQDRPLLDSTAVVFGSGMGDSNTHDNS